MTRMRRRAAHALRCRLNLPSLWHRALAAVYGWAGHVARKDTSHPGHAAVLWRNVRWWEIMKSARGPVLVITVGDIAGKNWVRSFEHGLSKILGVNWWRRLRILVAAVGKKASVSLFMMLYGAGEDPSHSGKRPFSTIWP